MFPILNIINQMQKYGYIYQVHLLPCVSALRNVWFYTETSSLTAQWLFLVKASEFSRVFVGSWSCAEGEGRWCVGWEVGTIWRMAQFLLLGRVSEWLPITQRLSLQELLLFQLLTEGKKAGSFMGCFLNQLHPCGWYVFFS